jgi:hypothetical protein
MLLFLIFLTTTVCADLSFSQRNEGAAPFNITCPPDYYGSVEDSSSALFGEMPVVTGLGCNDTEPILCVLQYQEPVYLKRVYPFQSTRDTISVAGTSVPCETGVHTETPVTTPVILNGKRSVAAFPDNSAKTTLHYQIEVTKNQTVDWQVTGDINDDTNEGLFTEMDGTTLGLISWPHNVKFNLFQNSSCAASAPHSMVRFDNEAQRFVVSTTNVVGTVICVALATGADTTGDYRVFEFQHGSFAITGWYFSVWGDYYNACWMNGGTQRWCGVMERQKMVSYNASDLPKMVIGRVDGDVDSEEPFVSMYQDKFARGPLINTHAPCGVFSVLGSGVIQTRLCTAVDFETGAMNVTENHVNVGSYVPFNSCIPAGTMCKTSFYRSHRMAYHYRDGTEKVAYAFIKYYNGISVMAWGETLAPLTTNPTAHHHTFDPYYHGFGHVNMWVPSLAYDCRSNLFVLYNRILYGEIISLDFTFRIWGDPPGTLRNPETFGAPVRENEYLSTWGHTHAVSGTVNPRRFFGIGSTSDKYASAMSTRIANATLTYKYGAQDACGNMATCIRTFHLTNAETC